jgi:hypothetical protein
VVARIFPLEHDTLPEREVVVGFEPVEEFAEVELPGIDLCLAGFDARSLKDLADHNEQVG